MSGIETRTAGKGDLEFTFKVKERAFREYVEKLYVWDESFQRNQHERRFAEQDVLIISYEGVEVGFATMELLETELHLNQLFILPEFQGKGIGAGFMNLLHDKAKNHGAIIKLRVLKVNPRALAFYERLGMTVCGEIDTHYLLAWS